MNETTIERIYRIGQYIDDDERRGLEYSVVLYVNGEETLSHDLLTFGQLQGYLLGISEFPRDRTSIRFVNGGIARKSPMGNTIKPITGHRLNVLLKKFEIETFTPVAGPAARELH